MIHIEEENLREGFSKFHIRGFSKDAVIHKIDKPDYGVIHDHPHGMNSFIFKGSYIDRVYTVNENGIWSHEDFHRQEGQAHYISATCIHEILELPDGECLTFIIPDPWERKSGFWRFENGQAMFREWDQPEFKPVNN